MNKGFISIGIIVAVIVTAVVTAGAGYGAYKYLETKENAPEIETEDQNKSPDIVGTTTESIEENTPNSVSGQTETKSNTNLVPQITPIQKAVQEPEQITPVEDKCPNISGIQEEIPQGLIFYRNENACMTESDIDALENAKAEAEAKEQNCSEAKQEAVNIAVAKQEALLEHQQNVAEIQSNPSGASAGAVASEVSQESARYNLLEESLNAQLTTVNYEIQLYCN